MIANIKFFKSLIITQNIRNVIKISFPCKVWPISPKESSHLTVSVSSFLVPLLYCNDRLIWLILQEAWYQFKGKYHDLLMATAQHPGKCLETVSHQNIMLTCHQVLHWSSLRIFHLSVHSPFNFLMVHITYSYKIIFQKCISTHDYSPALNFSMVPMIFMIKFKSLNMVYAIFSDNCLWMP